MSQTTRASLARCLAILLVLSGGLVGALRFRRVLTLSWWYLAPGGVVAYVVAALLFVYWARMRRRPRHGREL